MTAVRNAARSMWIPAAVAAVLFSQAFAFDEGQGKMMLTSEPFGKTAQDEEVQLFTLTNAAGNKVKLTNYGAILVSVEVPDREGNLANVNLGFPNLAGYLQRHPYFGATVGRFCNRIALGKFMLDGKEYSLVTNNGPNHLHGGTIGFDKLVWKAKEVKGDDHVGVEFTVVSPDGQEGYPGNLSVTTLYTWNNDNELKIAFTATTDKATPINLTNHSYWNLSGAGSGMIYEHRLTVNADQFLTVDDTLIPTGGYTPVEGTPLDFRQMHPIGERIEQLPQTGGYDHCFVIRGEAGQLRMAAKVVDPKSGRGLEISTTQPGVQLYTGNFLAGSEATGGFTKHSAFCLETQHYPDSPNKPSFPTSILKPGETFSETTVHKFTVEK